MYVNLNTGELVTVSQARVLHPSVSIPEGADLSHLGLAFLLEDPRPPFSLLRRSVPGPIVQRDGSWYATWVETDAVPGILGSVK